MARYTAKFAVFSQIIYKSYSVKTRIHVEEQHKYTDNLTNDNVLFPMSSPIINAIKINAINSNK